MSERKIIVKDRETARRVISTFKGHCMEAELDAALQDAPAPVLEGTTRNAVETEESKVLRAAWDKSNRKAKGYLLQHLSPDDAESVSALTTSETVTWLESRYVVVRVQNSFTTAIATISQVKVDRGNSWPQILTKFNKIEAAASTINNLDNNDIGVFGPIAVAGFLLNALPEKFSSLYQAYMEKALDKDNFNSLAVKQSVEAACIRSGKSHDRPSQVAQDKRSDRSRSGSPRPSNNDYGTCSECGKHHNLKEACRASDYTKKLYKANKVSKIENDRLAAKVAGIKKSNRRPVSSSSSSGKSSNGSFTIHAASCRLKSYHVSISPSASASVKLDSAAESHLTNDFSLLTDVVELKHPIPLDQVAKVEVQGVVGEAYVTHVGNMLLKTSSTKVGIQLSNVYWGKDLVETLISVSLLDDAGFTFGGGKGRFRVYSPKGILALDATKISGMYVVDNVIRDKETPSANTTKSKATQEQATLWHGRTGHLNWSSLAKLSSVTPGMPLISIPKHTPLCLICQDAKQARKASPPQTSRIADGLLQLVHSDLAGPFIPSLGGASYFMGFTDDFSRFSVIYFLKHKSEAMAAFESFRAESELQTGCRIKAIRTDNGGEYTSKRFENLLSSAGIQSQFTAPDSPEFNGVSERLNRTLADKVRALLLQSNLPLEFWAESMRAAVQIKNMVPTRSLPTGVTPFQVYYGKVPSVDCLRVFGSVATVINQSRDSKLHGKTIKCIVLSYGGQGKYRLFDTVNSRIKISSYRDIQFFENEFLSKQESSNLSSLTSDVCISSADTSLPPKVFGPDLPTRAQKKKGNRTALNVNAARLPEKAYVHGDDGFMETDALGDPKSFKAAHAGPYDKEWTAAELKEIETMLRLKVFKPIRRKDVPKGTQLIPLKWVYKTKFDADNFRTHKARLCARGDRQASDSYGETFAPVSKMAALRLLFAWAAHKNLEVRQWDYIAAFLQAFRSEHRMFCVPPQGCGVDPDIIWESLMALYGSRDSANLWNERMRKGLESLGWHQLSTDLGIYKHKCGALMGIWVDDCVVCAKRNHFQARYDEISKMFHMKDLGQIRKCLGMQITVDLQEKFVRVTQSDYAKDILKEFGMDDCSTRKTPFDPSVDMKHLPMPDSGSPEQREASKFPYRRLVGKLMYLMLGSRPDLAHAVGVLSRFTHNPSLAHILAAKHVLRYICGTSHYGLQYTQQANSQVQAYSDADWGGDESRRSTTGYIYLCSGSPISWASKLQQTVALSTTEAEYYAISEAIKEGLWLHSLCAEARGSSTLISIATDGPPLHLFGDNKGAIDLAKKSSYSGRTKHIDIKHAFIKELVSSKRVKISYVCTSEMIADCLTKSVNPIILEKNIRGMGLYTQT